MLDMHSGGRFFCGLNYSRRDFYCSEIGFKTCLRLWINAKKKL